MLYPHPCVVSKRCDRCRSLNVLDVRRGQKWGSSELQLLASVPDALMPRCGSLNVSAFYSSKTVASHLIAQYFHVSILWYVRLVNTGRYYRELREFGSANTKPCPRHITSSSHRQYYAPLHTFFIHHRLIAPWLPAYLPNPRSTSQGALELLSECQSGKQQEGHQAARNEILLRKCRQRGTDSPSAGRHSPA